MESCIFCRIVAGEVPAGTVLEDEEFVAFSDLNPKAPTHLLVVPRDHIRSVNELVDKDEEFGHRLLRFVVTAARNAGISESGYRVVVNTGSDAGRKCRIFHVHLLGGQQLGDLA
jgi:histidine triad (HIT) family protein